MRAKLAGFVITMIVNFAAGVVLFFIMLMTMNGYSESDAAWGLGAFAVLAFAGALLTSFAAVSLTGRLLKKRLSTFASLLISVTIFSGVGIAVEIVCSLIGVGAAELIRVKF